jgi:hypothetical protein
MRPTMRPPVITAMTVIPFVAGPPAMPIPIAVLVPSDDNSGPGSADVDIDLRK